MEKQKQHKFPGYIDRFHKQSINREKTCLNRHTDSERIEFDW